MSIFGDLIVQLRNDRDWTQERMAAEMGVAQSVIASYEKGRHEPKLSTLNRMLEPLGWRVVVVLEKIKEGENG